MNEIHQNEPRNELMGDAHSEMLLLPDGRILVHNLTRAMAALLHELNPEDDTIKSRIAAEPLA